MSNASDFFKGGGSGFLGLTPPKASTSFLTDPGTVAFNGDKFELAGLRMPILGSNYEHLSLEMIRGSDTGQIRRGKNTGSALVWANLLTAYGTVTQRAFTGGVYYDTINSKLYWLGHQASNTALSAVHKTDIATGAIEGTLTLTGMPNGAQYDWFNNLEPINPNDPDAGGWRILSYDQASTLEVAAYETNAAGALVATKKFVVDNGGADQANVRSTAGYLTANRDLMIASMGAVGSPAGTLLVIIRGSTRVAVVLPFDGDLPYPLDSAIGITGVISPGQDLSLLVWGDSVIVNASTATTAEAYLGRRIFDRADFDRWLHEVADAYGAGPAEVYFT